MSRFSEEMRVIPKTAWAIAVLLYLGFVALTWFIFIPRDEGLRAWAFPGIVIFAGIMPLFLAVYVLLAGYVYADARRRGMRHVMWTLLAIFVPNAIGIILYFIMRDPLLRPCPACGHTASSGYSFCPKCGTALSRACPECRSAVQPEWSHCTKCGAQLLQPK
jgi:Double zinc ribbon